MHVTPLTFREKRAMQSCTITKFIQGPYLMDAFKWLSLARCDYHANDSVWFFRRDFHSIYLQVIQAFRQSAYHFSPVKKIVFPKGDRPPTWIWEAVDAWVLKALSLYLQEILAPQISPNCLHVKGHGGISKGLEIVMSTDFQEYPFVFKSDIESYYQTMDHIEILRLFKKYIHCDRILDLIEKFLKHVEYDDGFYNMHEIGISKGCPLSPLIGALYLSELDELMKDKPYVYCRFQDDWIIFAKKRWHLRKAIKVTNELLNKLKVVKHPNKTIIGRSKNEISFLGFQLSAKGIADFSKSTKEKIGSHLRKLYEQGCRPDRINKYIDGVKTWVRGVLGRISCLAIDLPRQHRQRHDHNSKECYYDLFSFFKTVDT